MNETGQQNSIKAAGRRAKKGLRPRRRPCRFSSSGFKSKRITSHNKSSALIRKNSFRAFTRVQDSDGQPAGEGGPGGSRPEKVPLKFAKTLRDVGDKWA